MNPSQDIPKSCCPQCGYEFDACTALENGQAKPGDISLCINCGTIMVFTEVMAHRSATEDELRELTDSQLELVLRAHKTIIAQRI